MSDKKKLGVYLTCYSQVQILSPQPMKALKFNDFGAFSVLEMGGCEHQV